MEAKRKTKEQVKEHERDEKRARKNDKESSSDDDSEISDFEEVTPKTVANDAQASASEQKTYFTPEAKT